MSLHKKWNISILVIFVLLATSLLGVLALNFVQNMTQQSVATYQYYQSYYLAKAGIEYNLSVLPVRGIGFSHTLQSGSASFLRQNFDCQANCDVWFDLQGSSAFLAQNFWEGSGCLHPFVLATGDSLLIPLVHNAFTGNWAASFSTTMSYTNALTALKDMQFISTGTAVVWGMITLSGQDTLNDGMYFRTGDIQLGLHQFLNDFQAHVKPFILDIQSPHIAPYTFYFMISNPGSDALAFCMSGETTLPTQQVYLKSRGRAGTQTIGLEAVIKQAIPDYLLQTYSNL